MAKSIVTNGRFKLEIKILLLSLNKMPAKTTHHKKRVTGFAAYVKKNYHTEAKHHAKGKATTVIKALAVKYRRHKHK